MRKDYIGTINMNSTEEFTHFVNGCMTLRAHNNDISAVEIINLGERVDMTSGRNKIFSKQASKQAS